MLRENNRKGAGFVRCMAAVILSGSLVVSSCLAYSTRTDAADSVDTELHNPVVEMNTCDTVYFGSYWQEDTNGDGVADQNDEKTPIRWRILSRDGDDAYVMADQVLDNKLFHEYETEENVTWENSTLRGWLNGDFFEKAFTVEEQEAVLEQTLVNENYDDYGRDEDIIGGGENTVDKVYLLSASDIVNEDYGFSEDDCFADQARIRKMTDYAKEQRVYKEDDSGDSWWWLRTPCGIQCVSDEGGHGSGSFGSGMQDPTGNGVCPALHLNLASSYVRNGEAVDISLKAASWDLVELGTYDEETIIWRVLEVSGNDVFLLSDRILLDKEYAMLLSSFKTWEDSDLRKWLNGQFYQNSFSEQEKDAIQLYAYPNVDFPNYNNIEGGGNDTDDYVSLLSLQDIVNSRYGFPTDYKCSHMGRAATSVSGTIDDDCEGISWWLRSMGYIGYGPAYVDFYYGDVCQYNHNGHTMDRGVRPVLHFNCSMYPLEKVGTYYAEAKHNEYQWNKPRVPDSTEQPGSPNDPSATKVPNGSGSTDFSKQTDNSSVSDTSSKSTPNYPTKVNIKNKKKYSLAKKLTIQDNNGIQSVKLNGKTIKIKRGKKNISFKLSKYKNKLKKKGKWNRLVIIDQKGKRKTIKFKIK